MATALFFCLVCRFNHLVCCFKCKRHISSEFPLVCTLLRQFIQYLTHTQMQPMYSREIWPKNPFATNSMSMEYIRILYNNNWTKLQIGSSDVCAVKKNTHTHTMQAWSSETSLEILCLWQKLRVSQTIAFTLWWEKTVFNIFSWFVVCMLLRVYVCWVPISISFDGWFWRINIC